MKAPGRRRRRRRPTDKAKHDPDLTATLLDFAEPAISGASLETTAAEFKQALEFVVNIWNVLIVEAKMPHTGILKDLRNQFAKNDVDQQTIDMLETLVKRREEKFKDDMRTMTGLVVNRRDDGNFAVRISQA